MLLSDPNLCEDDPEFDKLMDKHRDDLSQGRKWSDELDEREGGYGDLEPPEEHK